MFLAQSQKLVIKIPPATFSTIQCEYGRQSLHPPNVLVHLDNIEFMNHRTGLLNLPDTITKIKLFFSLQICSPGKCESVRGSGVPDQVQL